VIAAALVALLAALFFAIGSVAQQRAASQVDTAEASGLSLIWILVRRPLWWAGFLGDAGGYVCQAIALGLGSLLLVQPLLVVTLIFALPIGAAWNRRKLTRADWLWAAVLTGALAVFMVVGEPSEGVDHAPVRDWALVGGALGVLVALAAVGASLTKGVVRASLLAVATGVGFGLAAALTKSVVDQLTQGLLEPFTHFELYALVVSGGLGVYFQSEAFQAGSLEASLPAMTVIEPVVAAGVGISILQEHLRSSGLEIALIAVTVVVMIAGTVELARSAARSGGV
jgi:drug/metabolite transporter (DMT)-like permease